MRQNQPVTQRSVDVPESVTLLSTTDLDSHIRYANAAFTRISGFSRQELLGQPHNLVRHPDMPAVAFEDMWRTIQAGDPWTALVKNRRRDGDHYWVRANAAPIERGGTRTGYISVRTRPSDEEIAAAERLYSEINAGTAGDIAFRKGIVVRRGWRRPISWMRTMSVRTRLVLALALASLPTLLVLSGLIPVAPSTALLVAAQFAGLATAAFMLEAQIAAPLREVLDLAKSVASGQPRRPANLGRVDEIGLIQRAINQSGLNLRALVDDVAQQSSVVATASAEIAAGNSDLASRTETSAANIEETSAAMEKLSESVQQNAAAATRASKLAGTASTVATQSGQEVALMVKTMGEIQESSRRIADIIGVIDGIAFQTNLLALNAAVEAARAGEHGRGFAVVASEVRELSQRCKQAASEIRTLISNSVERVGSGTQVAGRVGMVMQEVVTQVANMHTLIEEISAATHDQSTGISHVRDAITDLDTATQQNAALVEEISAAAESLREQAAQLADSVAVFSANDRADAARGHEGPRPKMAQDSADSAAIRIAA